MNDSILCRTDNNGIATLTLNRPEKFNALSSEMLTALQSQLDNIKTDATVRVVIIAAVGGKAFSAGHDLKEMRQSDDIAFHQKLFKQCGTMMLTIHQMPQPVIAQVDGIATAAGCQLVANCDLAVATNRSRFAVSGVNLGLFCSTPSVPLSRNINRKHAMKMLLTGEFIDADKALQFGLINEVVEVEDLAKATLAIATSIAAKPAATIALGKDMFYKQLSMNLENAYEYASERMACNMDTDEAREGIDAFLQKRSPNWQ